MDVTAVGLGRRSQHYAAIIGGGIVTSLFIEPERGQKVSSAEAVLATL
jgi:peroxiredoxin